MRQYKVPAPTKGAQMSLIFEPRMLDGLSAAERAKARLTLARILMQAAGVAVEEAVDDRQ
ncbi:hypothetical protein MMA231_02172 [Asticcacaulis sp. MM231]|uniref:hypothetical protein n=1 Tax=Asticcacaulis sp. MM231 TaxID=3157666 RepID=UPI0032D5A7F1